MENRQLFINNISVDFFGDDDPLPLIFGVNDLGNLQSLQGGISKQFKLPLTQKNREVFGFPDDITITNNLPYTQLPAKYIIDGIEVVANGLVEVQNVQDRSVNIILLFGNIDLLDNLGGQIYDMGDSTSVWSGYGTNLVWNKYSLPVPLDPTNIENCVWDVQHAAYSQQKTDGWIWPVVNYGGIDTTPPFLGHINVRKQRPGFFLHTAIELLIESTGYTIDKNRSCIYNDVYFADLYKKLIIQFSNSSFEHGTDFQNTPDNLGVTLKKGLDQVISRSRADLGKPQTDIYSSDIPFSNVISFDPIDHYTAITNVNFIATVQFDLFVRGRLGGSQATEVIVKFTLVDPDGTITDFASSSYSLDNSSHVVSHTPLIATETFLNQKVSQDFSLVTGQKVYVRVHINNIGTDPSTDTYVIFRKGASLSIVTSEQTLLWKQPIQCERILPNIAQIDLLKDTLQRFGLILISDPNTASIILTSFKNIIGNIPNAKDWSEKYKDIGRQNSFQIGNYGQINKLQYQDDNAIPRNYMPQYFADDIIKIADKTLNPTQPVQVLFTSIFAPTLNSPYIGGTIAQISNPTSTDSFSVGDQPRLLVDQKISLANAAAGGQSLSVVFSDGDAGFETETVTINDVISVPYFYKSDGDYNLAWKDLPGGTRGTLKGLRSTYFSELETIFNQSKKVTRYIYLTPSDVVDFDFTIPVYLRQDGAYYYVAKIDSWIKGVPCKVDLIRLG